MIMITKIIMMRNTIIIMMKIIRIAYNNNHNYNNGIDKIIKITMTIKMKKKNRNRQSYKDVCTHWHATEIR